MVMKIFFSTFFFFVWCLGKHLIWSIETCGYGFSTHGEPVLLYFSFFFLFSLFDVWVSIWFDLLDSHGYGFILFKKKIIDGTNLWCFSVWFLFCSIKLLVLVTNQLLYRYSWCFSVWFLLQWIMNLNVVSLLAFSAEMAMHLLF